MATFCTTLWYSSNAILLHTVTTCSLLCKKSLLGNGSKLSSSAEVAWASAIGLDCVVDMIPSDTLPAANVNGDLCLVKNIWFDVFEHVINSTT